MQFTDILKDPGAVETLREEVKLAEIQARAMIEESIDLTKMSASVDPEVLALLAKGIDQMLTVPLDSGEVSLTETITEKLSSERSWRSFWGEG